MEPKARRTKVPFFTEAAPGMGIELGLEGQPGSSSPALTTDVELAVSKPSFLAS